MGKTDVSVDKIIDPEIPTCRRREIFTKGVPCTFSAATPRRALQTSAAHASSHTRFARVHG
jgi:hypothetical protein